MQSIYCQIVLVGHEDKKLIWSIDKEIINKLIFIAEKEYESGSERKIQVLDSLNAYYSGKKVLVEITKFDFKNEAKPIAELTYKTLQQKLLGYQDIKVNISGGLRYIDIWLYIACSLTDTEVIHGNYLYEGNQKVGILGNKSLMRLSLEKITKKQFNFLKLFFNGYKSITDFIKTNMEYDSVPLLNKTKTYESIKEIKSAYEAKIIPEKTQTRGAINGLIKQLKEKNIIDMKINPKEKIKKKISISYIGIAYFLNELYKFELENK